jgi:hypothetical protein
MAQPELRIHPSWVKEGGIVLEIMEGRHDAALDMIQQACRARLKTQFRKGQTMRLTGTRNVELDGMLATIIKINAKTVTVGVGPKNSFGGYEREYNVPPRMLEAWEE